MRQISLEIQLLCFDWEKKGALIQCFYCVAFYSESFLWFWLFLQQSTHLLLCSYRRSDTFYSRVMTSPWGETSFSNSCCGTSYGRHLPGEQTSFIQSTVTAVYPSDFNATTVAPAAGAASIWLSESAVDLQPFYRDCIKKAQPEPWFYGRAFPRSHWPDGYYEDKSNFHANTLIHSRGWSMAVCWRMAWLGVKEGLRICARVCVCHCVCKWAFYDVSSLGIKGK